MQPWLRFYWTWGQHAPAVKLTRSLAWLPTQYLEASNNKWDAWELKSLDLARGLRHATEMIAAGQLHERAIGEWSPHGRNLGTTQSIAL